MIDLPIVTIDERWDPIVNGRTGGMLHVPNTVVQDPDFRRAVRVWARAVRTLLDQLSRAAFQQTPRADTHRRGAVGVSVNRS